MGAVIFQKNFGLVDHQENKALQQERDQLKATILEHMRKQRDAQKQSDEYIKDLQQEVFGPRRGAGNEDWAEKNND